VENEMHLTTFVSYAEQRQQSAVTISAQQDKSTQCTVDNAANPDTLSTHSENVHEHSQKNFSSILSNNTHTE